MCVFWYRFVAVLVCGRFGCHQPSTRVIYSRTRLFTTRKRGPWRPTPCSRLVWTGARGQGRGHGFQYDTRALSTVHEHGLCELTSTVFSSCCYKYDIAHLYSVLKVIFTYGTLNLLTFYITQAVACLYPPASPSVLVSHAPGVTSRFWLARSRPISLVRPASGLR